MLWLGATDSLVNSHLVRPVARDWLEELATQLVSDLREAHSLSQAPEFPEVDVDERTVFDAHRAPPLWKKITAAMSGDQCLGGFLVFFSHALQGFDELFSDASTAFAVSFLLRRQQLQIDAAADRLKEISEVGRIFAHVGEPERTMSRILDLAIRSSGAEIGALVHYDRAGQLAATGMQIDSLRAIRFRGGDSLVERVMLAQKESIHRASRLSGELESAVGPSILETLATFPLLHEGRSYGSLILINIADVSLAEDPLVAMLATVARLAAAAITTEERQRERLEQERTRQELKAARTIQQSLMPRSLPSVYGLRMAGLWKPSRSLGGDYYDIFPLGQDRLGVVIADVSGKGLPAGLLMAITRSYLRVIAAEEGSTPGRVLSRVNERLAGEIADNRFVTANYLEIDMVKREARLANAGHHAPALVAPDGSVRMLDAEGLPLGVFADTLYDDVSFPLAPGSTLVLYTDGLLETKNSRGDMLGKEGLLEMLVAVPQPDPSELLNRLWETTLAFAENHEPGDDWTAVVLSFAAET